MDEKEHSIRFINSSYDTLFRIPDGETVEVQFPDRKFTARCKYLAKTWSRMFINVFCVIPSPERYIGCTRGILSACAGSSIKSG